MFVSDARWAGTQPAGPNYFSAWGGYKALDDSDLETPGGDLESSFDDGFGVGVAYGRWFDAQRHWRGELGLSYRENDVDDVSGIGYAAVEADGVGRPGSGVAGTQGSRTPPTAAQPLEYQGVYQPLALTRYSEKILRLAHWSSSSPRSSG